MHHILQVAGTPDEVKKLVSDEATKASASNAVYDSQLLAALSALVTVVLQGCSGKVSVSVLANAHSAEHRRDPQTSDAEVIKHSLQALADGKAQSLSLSIKATLTG